MKKIYFLIVIFLHIIGFSQKSNDTITDNRNHKKSIAIITGYHLQKNHFAEIGIGILKNSMAGYHPSTIIYGISNEFKLHDDFIWGLKMGFWIGGGASAMNLGINVINYTNFSDNSIHFRPEIGFGFNTFRVVYGYNLAIINKDFQGINTHNFGVNFLIKLKGLKE